VSQKTKKIKEKIIEGIRKFNEIRSPEAKVELVKIKGNEVLTEFSGHMCFTCGTYDYFEDFVYEMKDLRVDLEIKNFKRENNERYLVTFLVKGRKK